MEQELKKEKREEIPVDRFEYRTIQLIIRKIKENQKRGTRWYPYLG